MFSQNVGRNQKKILGLALGTPYGIYSSLKKLLPKHELVSLEFGKNRHLAYIRKIKNIYYRLRNIDSCGINDIQEESAELAKFSKENPANSYLMFSEHQFPGINESYLFIDCSVDFTVSAQ